MNIEEAFQILGIEETATRQSVRHAYAEKSKIYPISLLVY